MNWLHSLQDPLATSSSLQSIRRSGRMSDVEALYKKMKAEIDRKKYYGLGDVSEKMRVLVQLLSTYRGRPGFSAIIFTEQRHHALALATILGKSQTLQSFIRPTYLVGHGSSGVERLASEGMAARVVSRQRHAVHPHLSVRLTTLTCMAHSNGAPLICSEVATSTCWSLQVSPKRDLTFKPATSSSDLMSWRRTLATSKVVDVRARRTRNLSSWSDRARPRSTDGDST